MVVKVEQLPSAVVVVEVTWVVGVGSSVVLVVAAIGTVSAVGMM